MTNNNAGDRGTTIAALVYNLCCRTTGLSGGSVSRPYQFALNFISGTHSSVCGEADEFTTAERIKKKLVKEKRERDAVFFGDLHRKLQACSLLRNRAAVLQLMLTLSTPKGGRTNATFFGSHSTRLSTSAPTISMKNSSKVTNGDGKSRYSASFDDDVNSAPDFSTLPAINSHLASSLDNSKRGLEDNRKTNGDENVPSYLRGNRVARVAAMFASREKFEQATTLQLKSPTASSGDRSKELFSGVLPLVDVSEHELLRDLLFAFQGIEGKIIKREPAKETFYVDTKLRIYPPMKNLVLRLVQLGSLYYKVQKFCTRKKSDPTFGLVGQSLVSAVQDEMTEFYRLLAILESQLHQDGPTETNQMSRGLTLRRLTVWCIDPFVRMKFLAALVDSCEGHKGGALVSVVHSFLQHGDPMIHDLFKHILDQVIQPILNMLKSWMLNGELEDVFQEFFIASSTNPLEDTSLWYEKYSLCKPMVPSFLTTEVAKKILSTGKAINFLRVVCRDITDFKAQRTHCMDLNVGTIESLFTMDKDSVFHSLLDRMYKDISAQVLRVLHDRFHFMDHLQAMRRYLLLGQGDFIRHLMDLLECELVKPGKSVHLHNLSEILECAVRSTNAQFDSQDIIHRIDVKLNDLVEGDLGWDIFTLDYHVTGPIGTIFTPNCKMSYLKLFNSLWRTKRMEYILSGMWKTEMTHSRMAWNLPEVKEQLHEFQMLLIEMVHFVQQMQYYIAFEVMECCWAELQGKVKSATDLDQVIAAHEEFLDTILTQALLDEESEGLLNRLRLIYDAILRFQKLQEDFFKKTDMELAARASFKGGVDKKTESGKWGTTQEADLQETKRRQSFTKDVVKTTGAQFRICAGHFRETVHIFLEMLMDHQDPNLRFLSFRLDFNEYYKKQNRCLQTSLTFQHRRKSMKL